MMWFVHLVDRLFRALAGLPPDLAANWQSGYIKYRGYLITQEWSTRFGKPQPDEWCYAHEEFEGPEDHRCGWCATMESCKEEIDDNIQLENYAVGLVDPAELKRQGGNGNGRIS